MAGLFPGICNIQNVDRNGQPLRGSVLTIYQGGTLTLANCYQDIGLAIPAQNPMTADDTSRLPIFFVADGTYRVRLVDQYGIQVFDYPQVPSIGASSSGGGGSAVDPATIFQTGDPIWVPVQGSRTGWVRAAGRTIGSATSGASERANSDCQNLFLYLWNNYPDSICAVSTGRGASAAADWAANKAIVVLDMRAKGPFGLTDMGNSAVTEFDGLTFTRGDGITAASLLGAGKKAILQANLPSVNFVVDIPAGQGSHVHGGVTTTSGSPTNFGGGTPGGVAGNTSAATLPALAGTAASGGSGTAFDKMSPAMLGSWYLKL